MQSPHSQTEKSAANHGFKEWLGVCSLLLAGNTSLLLRKGGIHEGRDGFAFKHRQFFLFPTSFHEETHGLVSTPPPPPGPPATPENGVTIHAFARALTALRVRNWSTVAQLAPFHPWAENVVRDRFNYSEKLEAECISIALVRVYRLTTPWHLPYEKKFGGCRSWVDLPQPPAAWHKSLTPVLDDNSHDQRAEKILSILTQATPPATPPPAK